MGWGQAPVPTRREIPRETHGLARCGLLANEGSWDCAEVFIYISYPKKVSVERRPSSVSVSSVTVDVDSCASSPGIPRRSQLEDFELKHLNVILFTFTGRPTSRSPLRKWEEHSTNNQLSQNVTRKLIRRRCLNNWCWLAESLIKTQALLEKFQTASFAELCSITMANKPAESLYHCLNDIYGRFIDR